MASIDHKNLKMAMDRAPLTATQLAEITGKSLTYICDITSGRRTLKRNPDLRRAIADAIGCPTHWIEHQGGSDVGT